MWVDSTSRTSRSYVSAADWVFLPKFNRRIVVAPPQNHHHHNVHSSRVGMPLPPQVMAKKQSAKSPWMCVTVLCFSSILMIPRHHPNIKAYTILSHTNIIIILKNNLLIFGYIFYVQVQYYRSPLSAYYRSPLSASFFLFCCFGVGQSFCFTRGLFPFSCLCFFGCFLP